MSKLLLTCDLHLRAVDHVTTINRGMTRSKRFCEVKAVVKSNHHRKGQSHPHRLVSLGKTIEKNLTSVSKVKKMSKW